MSNEKDGKEEDMSDGKGGNEKASNRNRDKVFKPKGVSKPQYW